MKRTIYLIDYENVHEAGLQGMESCPSGCAIHLFYSQNANRLNLDLLRGLKASFTVHKVHPGRQSLDMQLVSYLGFLIGREGAECRYVIVSKDRDFANTPSFWQMEAGIEVVRQSTLDGTEPSSAVPAARRSARSSRSSVSSLSAANPAAPSPSEAEVSPSAEPSAEDFDKIPASAPEDSSDVTSPEMPDIPSEDVPEEASGNAVLLLPETLPVSSPADSAETPKAAKPNRQRKPAGKRSRQDQAPKSSKPSSAQPDRKTRLNNRLMQVLSENQVDNATTMKAVAVTISHYSDKNIKQMTYRSIIKEFGQKRGLALYNLIKPVLEADAKQN